MPRRHPSRASSPVTIAGVKHKCWFCPAFAPARKLACRSCWSRLQSAPGSLRDRLSVPEGESPRTYTGQAYRDALAEASRYLAKVRAAS